MVRHAVGAALLLGVLHAGAALAETRPGGVLSLPGSGVGSGIPSAVPSGPGQPILTAPAPRAPAWVQPPPVAVNPPAVWAERPAPAPLVPTTRW